MIVNEQKPIEFINDCNCVVDYKELASAIIWYSDKPVARLRKIYMHGNYPAVSIYHEKIHVHRLLMMYWSRRKLKTKEHVHHKNGNRLNALKDNLEIVMDCEHLSQHHKGKKLSNKHREKISEANKKRKGSKQIKTVNIPLCELKEYLNKGYSISKISKIYKCDWSTVRARIYENPEILEVEDD